jgi:integrase
MLDAIANGGDPQVEPVAARDALTVAEIIDLYLREGLIDNPTKRTSTWVVDRSNLDCHVRPMIATRVANEVTQRDCTEFQRAIAIGKTKADVRTKPRGRAIVLGGPGTAARTMVTLATMLNWADKRGLIVSNPAQGVPRLKSDRVDRFLSQEELTRLFRGFKDAEPEYAIALSHDAIIRLLAFTGARKSEILSLPREGIDFQHSAIVLAASRSKTTPNAFRPGLQKPHPVREPRSQTCRLTPDRLSTKTGEDHVQARMGAPSDRERSARQRLAEQT